MSLITATGNYVREFKNILEEAIVDFNYPATPEFKLYLSTIVEKAFEAGYDSGRTDLVNELLREASK